MKYPHTPLPWQYTEKGFSLNMPIPTIFTLTPDLEIVAKVPFDGLIDERIQDNKKNAEYIIQACNNFTKAIELLNQSLLSINQAEMSEEIKKFLNDI